MREARDGENERLRNEGDAGDLARGKMGKEENERKKE